MYIPIAKNLNLSITKPVIRRIGDVISRHSNRDPAVRLKHIDSALSCLNTDLGLSDEQFDTVLNPVRGEIYFFSDDVTPPEFGHIYNTMVKYDAMTDRLCIQVDDLANSLKSSDFIANVPDERSYEVRITRRLEFTLNQSNLSLHLAKVQAKYSHGFNLVGLERTIYFKPHSLGLLYRNHFINNSTDYVILKTDIAAAKVGSEFGESANFCAEIEYLEALSTSITL